MNAFVLAATSPSTTHPQHAFGGGVLILAVLVIAALGYGATRLTRGRRSRGHQPEPPWPSGRPAPPPETARTAPPGPLDQRPSRATEPKTEPETEPKGGWAVQTHGLTKRFGSNVAVDDVELRVPRGAAFGYLGPNGAGKTTLIRTLLGLTRADAGTMSLLGIPVPAARGQALARVGAIVDEPRFHHHLTGRENLRLLAAARGGDAAGR